VNDGRQVAVDLKAREVPRKDTALNRQELIAEANRKLQEASTAHKEGNVELRDALLRQARDRFHAAEQTGMVLFCERFLKE
jgi:hypothetical protein